MFTVRLDDDRELRTLERRHAPEFPFLPINQSIRSTDVGHRLGERFAGSSLMTRALTAALDYEWRERRGA